MFGMDTETLMKIGAIYGALQGVGQVVMMFAGKNTVAFKIAKMLVSGPSRVDTAKPVE